MNNFPISEKIQIIGMTATIGNLNEVAAFLNAETYRGNFRPVELSEYVKCNDKIFSIDYKRPELFKEERLMKPTKSGVYLICL